MNLRQAQRALADLMVKCREAHIQLPILHLNDALDELKQIFGVDPVWIQHQQDEETKRRRRQKRGMKPKSPATIAPQPSGACSTGSKNEPQKQPSPTNHQSSKKETTESQKQHQSTRHQPPKSRINRIIERNPAENPENEELTEEFVKLDGYELKHGDDRRRASRMNVAKIIRNTDEPLRSGAQAKKTSGIGPSSAAKIAEVLREGKMHKLEEFESAEENEVADDEEEASLEV
ncbi:hypothetical protein FI667_g7013, partial [Globisporangium splendens]